MGRKHYKIHPAIGVARVGNANADDGEGYYFIGPEIPDVPANWVADKNCQGPFKLAGKIRRQAARFRIFEYEENADGSWSHCELTADDARVARIEWCVQLANRKAAFYAFDGQVGAGESGYDGAALRNPFIDDPAERDALLVIEPEPGSISGVDQGPMVLANDKSHIDIRSLGELRTDDAGRLLVIGGPGDAVYSQAIADQDTNRSDKDYRDLVHYANNDAWFDDVADGPVTAIVHLHDDGGCTIKPDPAWAIVGPPDFAPGLGNVVTLFDTLRDVAVRHAIEATPGGGATGPVVHSDIPELARDWNGSGLSTWIADYEREVIPLFERGLAMGWVHDKAFGRHIDLEPDMWLAYGQLPGDPESRRDMVELMRPPGMRHDYPERMPRLRGDDGDDSFATITALQYAMLARWRDGYFTPLAALPRTIQERARVSTITPTGLDRAALESCVGAAFFPGIEASWVLRNPALYAEPFRIDHGAHAAMNGDGNRLLAVRAGFLSQQMALPWQADFKKCADMWWPGQRPDSYREQPDGVAINWDELEQWATHNDMLDVWSTRRFVVVADDGRSHLAQPEK